MAKMKDYILDKQMQENIELDRKYQEIINNEYNNENTFLHRKSMPTSTQRNDRRS